MSDKIINRENVPIYLSSLSYEMASKGRVLENLAQADEPSRAKIQQDFMRVF